jgi:RHS repeat-associated protein
MTTSKDSNDLMNLTYNYDAAGNILNMKNEDSSSIREEWDYTYDPLDRLLTAAGGPLGETYSLDYQYDSTGNRIQLDSTTYTYNEMNELLSLSDPSGNSTFTYDIHGNLITKDDGQNLWEYSYDHENRLLSIKKDGQVTEEYFYDGDGKRIKKTDADSERVYIYGGLNVLYEVNTTTQMEAVYVYGPTGQLAKKVNDITEYYHTDHLGSTRLVTSENGVTTEEIMYKPFGEQLNETEERYTYNGKELDETGLYYYGARYYDPMAGRFISRDPLTGRKESPQTLNRYAYCLNNPLKYADPTGTDGEDPQKQVEEVFGRLENVNPNLLIEIQKLLDEGKEFEALVVILELLGFEYETTKNGGLSININDKDYTIQIDDDLAGWGSTNNHEGAESISINFSSRKVGDITLTILHEVCHAVLGGESAEAGRAQHPFIYGVEYSYMLVLNDFGVPISSTDLSMRKPNFFLHVYSNLLSYDPSWDHKAPISGILEKWRRFRRRPD